ncbi:MAG: CaiB/BaiF CoA transferase family protein [Hyphomicrobiaceae bacterium]
MHELRPLEGMSVLDLSQGIAGPHCGGLLAEYGARVVKIEPPGGDWMRPLGPGYGDRSAAFIYYNRGKESLALDLKAEGACEVVLNFAAKCDVLIENNRPGVSERLGFGYDVVRARNPKIVYVSVSGLGQTGPDATKPLSDTVAQAHSGMMMINRGRADVPAKIDTTIVDAITGLYAFQCATMALWGNSETRVARHLDISLAQAAAAIQGPKILEYGIIDGMPVKLNPPAGSYRTADGWLALTLVREADWQAICRVIDRPDLASDPKFDSFTARASNIVELTAILDDIIVGATTADWVERLSAEGVLASQINDYGQWLAHRQTRGTDAAPVIPVASPGEGPVARTPGLSSQARLSPVLGEHSRALLEEAGLSHENIEQLIAGGAAVAPE